MTQYVCIDDLLAINNNGLTKKHMNDICPKDLDLKHENSEMTKAHLTLT